jgi:hypothetical protein
MQKDTTALDYYMAENMSLARLKNEVCEQDAGACRACDCFKVCGIGRRYVLEVEAGRLMNLAAAQNKATVPQSEREHIKYLDRMAIVLAGKAIGKGDIWIAKQAGYSSVKIMRRALKHFFNARAEDGREAQAQ